MYFWNGETWTRQTLDPYGGERIHAFWAADPAHVWSVGAGGRILFWNGDPWSRQDSGVHDTLSGVWGADAERVVSGCGERHECAARAKAIGDRVRFSGVTDNVRGSAAEQAANLAVTVGAGNEDELTDAALETRRGLDDAAHGLVARHERVTHARKRRHGAVPQQALGAGADAAPVHLDRELALTRLREPEAAECHRSRLAHDDRNCIHVIQSFPRMHKRRGSPEHRNV